MKQCPKCKQILEDDYIACPYCGQRQSTVEEKEVIRNTKPCTKCKQQIPLDCDECIYCGQFQPINTQTNDDSHRSNCDNAEELPLNQENESTTAEKRKGLGALWWNCCNMSSLSLKSKFITTIKVTGISLGTIAIVLCLFILIFYGNPKVEMNANDFVNSWNSLSQTEEDITGGVEIKAEKGEKEYILGDDKKIKIYIRKVGIFGKKELENVEYINKNLGSYDKKKFLDLFLGLIPEITDKEKIADELLDKKTKSWIKEGLCGLNIDGLEDIEWNYKYPDVLRESKITGASYGVDLTTAIDNYKTEYIKKINGSHSYKLSPTNEEYINCAATLIDQVLKSPSTASYVSSEVVEKDTYGRAIVLLTVDSQNSFGAYMRTHFCVIIQGIRYDDTFDYSNSYYSEYTEYNKDSVIDIMKTLNKFGESRSGDLSISVSDFTKEEHSEYSSYTYSNTEFTVDKDSEEVFVVQCCFDKNKSDDINNPYTSLYSVVPDEYIHTCYDFTNLSVKDPYYYNEGVLCYAGEDSDNIYIGAVSMTETTFEAIKPQLDNKSLINAEVIIQLSLK